MWLPSRCRLRSTFRLKDMPQRKQAKGLKPECFRVCVMRFELCEKAFPQTTHLCGFSPVEIISVEQLRV